MKKLITIAAMAMVIGATVSRAQSNTVTVSNGAVIVAGPVDLDVKVKLNAATKLAAPTVTGVEGALVQGVVGGVTNLSFVLGTTILDSVTTSNTTGTITTNTVTSDISSNAWVESDNPVELGKGKFAAAAGARFFDVAGPFGTSNTEWFITGTVKAASGKSSNITVSAKAVGIWVEGVSSFSASISTVKAK